MLCLYLTEGEAAEGLSWANPRARMPFAWLTEEVLFSRIFRFLMLRQVGFPFVQFLLEIVNTQKVQKVPL